MATQLQTAMEGLIAVFHSYSGKEGDKYKLSRGELKNLLQGELADFLSVRIWTEARNWTSEINIFNILLQLWERTVETQLCLMWKISIEPGLMGLVAFIFDN